MRGIKMIEVGKKYGCLTVLDLGKEYKQTDGYKKVVQEYSKYVEKCLDSSHEYDNFVDDRKADEIKKSLETHYKCQCKCGKIHYYNRETLESNPKYCYYPSKISFYYRRRENDATYRKILNKKNMNIENITLETEFYCWPRDCYCELYNKHRKKELEKHPNIVAKHEKEEKEISREKWYNSLPHEYPSDFGKNKIGRIFGRMEIIGFEFTENLRYGERQNSFNEWYREKIVNAKCKCRLCGNIRTFDIEDFYVDNDMYGYISRVRCDCKEMSSFEWRTVKILEDNNIKYFMEQSFEGLVGADNKTPLRFDFTIVNEQNDILCFIECQGKQHYKVPTKKDNCNFEWTEWNLKRQQENDEKKREFAKKYNKPLIELKYTLDSFEKEKTYLEKELKNFGIIK